MGIENERKHSLGRRAFILFLSRRIKFAIFLFVLSFAAWYSERWVPALGDPAYPIWADFIVKILFLISIAYFLMVIFWTYMEYHYYTYTFTDEAFIMTYGY